MDLGILTEALSILKKNEVAPAEISETISIYLASDEFAWIRELLERSGRKISVWLGDMSPTITLDLIGFGMVLPFDNRYLTTHDLLAIVKEKAVVAGTTEALVWRKLVGSIRNRAEEIALEVVRNPEAWQRPIDPWREGEGKK